MIIDLLNFLNNAKTKYQAISITKDILKSKGYKEVSESDDYKGLDKFFIVRNNTSVIAISKPIDFKNKSINIICTHTDSPSFKINENSNVEIANYNILQTEVYGGPIYSSWFDRPLGIGGAVFYENEGVIKRQEVALDNICMIPNLCIHFNRDVNNGHTYNLGEMKPIYSNAKDIYDVIEDRYNISKDDILSFELELYNSEQGVIVGAEQEFFMAPRIDNLASHFTALDAFINNTSDTFKVFASFDNEEVGSSSMQGAASLFLDDSLRRVFVENGLSDIDYLKSLSNSIAISADNGHALHPNYVDKSDHLNAPVLNNGFVIKENPSLKYTTDGTSKSILVKLCQDNDIKYQTFRNKPGIAGGSTLGNILQNSISIHMVDVGLPQFAMHSAYESAGVYDLEEYYNIMDKFYSVDLKINNDVIIVK